MVISTAKIQDESCDECRCDTVQDNKYGRMDHNDEIVQCTHASVTKTKDAAVTAPSGPRAITSNSKVTVFSANRVLARLVNRMRKVYLRKDAHTKYRVPKACQLPLT